MGIVILAEKPDMGDKIANALGIKSKHRGYITLLNGDIVTWAIGHIIRLKTPDAYEEYKEWSLSALPIIPKQMETEIDPKKKDQFKVIAGLFKEASCVVIACDPGREGEHIGRTLIKQARYTGPIKRLWIQDLTKATIQKGFQELKDGSEYQNLAQAAQLRAYADYWIGFTASRFFSLIVREQLQQFVKLSAGRVQTPTLKLVYNREMEIEQFKEKEFYRIKTVFSSQHGNYEGYWFQQLEEGKLDRFESKEEAERLIQSLNGKSPTIVAVEKKEVKRFAPKLLESTAIKTIGRKYLGLSIQQTDKIVQKLYDDGYVSYPRTASTHLSENAAEELYSSLNTIQQDPKYQALFPSHYEKLTDKRYVDNSKAIEHHAIIPTNLIPKDLNQDEMKLYEWILKYTIAAHYPPGSDQEIKVITNIGEETFESKLTVVLEPGYRYILQDQEDEEETSKSSALSLLTEQDSIRLNNIDLHIGKTSKPKRYAEDELVKAMSNVGQKMNKDDATYELMKEIGIGTPATRTSIVSELIDREYIESKKNILYLTEKGRHFMEIVKDHSISSIELTADFETKLNDIAEGKRKAQEVAIEFVQYVEGIVQNKEQFIRVLKSNGNINFEAKHVICSCPSCGKDIVERQKFYGCEGYKDGCKVSFPKKYGTLSLTASIVKKLCEGKSVMVKFKGEKGSYERILRYDGEKLVTDIPSAADLSLGKCKLCQAPVLDKEKIYGCSRFKEGCTFKIPKVVLGVEIKPGQVKKILAKESDLLQGFTYEGKQFDAKLSYDVAKNKIVFVRGK